MSPHSHATRSIHDPVAGLRFVPQPAEPGHLWLRFAPRGWTGPEGPWLDLAAGTLGPPGRPAARRERAEAARDVVAAPASPPFSSRAATPAAAASGAARPGAAGPGTGRLGAAEPAAGDPVAAGAGAGLATLLQDGEAMRFDDLVYLPPAPGPLAASRDALARRVLAAGAPVLVQLLPGDRTSLAGEAGAVLVLDLLPTLLAGLAAAPGPLAVGTQDAQGGHGAPGAQVAVWPLLPGLTDDPELGERGARQLAAAGLRCVQAVAPALAAGDRRRLADAVPDLDEAALHALLHRPPPTERQLARAVHRLGLLPFLPRPLPARSGTLAENRRVAGCLTLAAELWLRLGRPVEPAQSLFRAARWLDATAYDVAALRRERNLAVVTAFGDLARRTVTDAVDHGEPALLQELLAEYLGDPPPPAARR